MSDITTAVRADLIRGNRLVTALNHGNPVLVQREPGGDVRGVSPALARELARRLEVEPEWVHFDSAGKVFAALPSGAWDVAFLAIDPARAAEIAFTAPYVVIEGSYVVPEGSALKAMDEVDRPGVRIAAGLNTAYDLYLTRTLEHAELVRAPTSAAALELFVTEGLDAAAGVRQPLMAFARARAGLRVIDGSFTKIQQAMGTPKSKPAGAAYLREFIEEMKASGFVARALEASGQRDASVAPPA